MPLYQNINGDKWKQTTMKKLISFLEKCPALFSIKTGIHEGADGVFIIHKNTGTEYFFPWDFDKEPQDFIHNIKMWIKPKHYPVLTEQKFEDHRLSSEELAKKIEEGANFNQLPSHEKRLIESIDWRIDKVVLWKDIVIMEKIGDPSRKQYRFKYNGSLVLFLKKYRSGEFKTVVEAGDEFFSNSILINEISPKT